MLKKIISSTGSRIITTIISLLIVILNSNQLHDKGIGIIAKIILDISLLQLLSGFIGGSALVYLVPRFDIFKIILLSYSWSILTSITGTILMNYFHLIPDGYSYHVFYLSLLQSLAAVNLFVLLGKEKIYIHNIISALQFVVTISCLLLLFYVLNKIEIISYIYSLYISYSFLLIISLVYIRPYIHLTSVSGLGEIIKQVFKYGSYVQVAAILTLLNFRLSYYFIDSYWGVALLGAYTIGVQVSEGLWLISRSMALVLYSKISNAGNNAYSKLITILFFKINLIIILIFLIPLLLLPSEFFVFIFGKEFLNTKMIISLMSIGIISVAVYSMLCHFFSGIGKHYLNTIGTAIGLVLTIVLGIVLIPRYGLKGAALTASLSYLSSLIFAMISFMKLTNTRFRELLPVKKEDYKYVYDELSSFFKLNF